MKRQIIFGTLFSAALAVGVAAQQPTPSPSQPSQPPASQPADAARTVTMAGCLQASSGAGGAGAGAAAATPAPAPSTPSQASGGFILANASPTGTMAGGAAAPTPGAPAGSPATAGTTGSTTTYRLTGGEDQNLQQYVGQRVEITGTLAGRGTGSGAAGAAGAAAPGAPAAPGSTAGAAGSTSPTATGPALRVSSVRSTGEKCSQ